MTTTEVSAARHTTSNQSNAASRWTLPSQDLPAAVQLAQQASLPLLIAQLLLCRGIATPEAAAAFLAPDIAHLHDPYRMLGMRAAVERILAAVAANETILVYGDYDVDGTIATVLLKTAIDRIATARGSSMQVRYHVPHRVREGYGMQTGVLADAHAAGVTLVLSVDTGIRAFAAADEAQRLGLDLIVTDHHLPEELGVPHALAVLNPNQAGCEYPCKHLCGAGVAFKLAQALLEAPATPASSLPPGNSAFQNAPSLTPVAAAKIIPSFLKLLCVATIADSVPLVGENRVITAIGLRELRRPVQGGLRELMRVAQLDPAKSLTTTDVAFRLAPRINAAGRMDIADDVVDLFLSRDPARCTELAEKLNRLNEERRAVEAAALLEIEAQIDAQIAELLGAQPSFELALGAESSIQTLEVSGAAGRVDSEPPKAGPTIESQPRRISCFVLDDANAPPPGWHRGVIGILASRVVDRTNVPALVITHQAADDADAPSQAHGSGRSVSGFHLLDALTAVDAGFERPLFTRFGGHAHAVGFSLPSALVPELRSRMQAYAALHVPFSPLGPPVACEGELSLDSINATLASWIKRFEPTGMGNTEPIFLARRVRIAAPPRVMKEKHLRLRVQQGQRGQLFNCLGWHWAAKAAEMNLAENCLIDLAYKLKENTHPDFGGLELEICGLARCDVEN
ncbi:MAG: single-stranded-DNA-specific exonuclease RecJ [Acidobacteriaceae bacterium]